MSVKKLLVLTAAGLAAIGATAAMAGGPDHMAMPSEPAFQNSVYLDVHAGYAQSNWTNFNSSNLMGTSASSLYTPNSNGQGGFTAGADLGYTITQNIAVEGGWFYLPQVKGNGTGSSSGAGGITEPTTASMKVDSWFAYGAAKLSVPVMQDLDLFGKVGVAYRSLSYSGVAANVTALNGGVAGSGSYWAPLFGAGIQYNLSNWALGAQYTYLPGNSSANSGNPLFGAPNAAPEVNLYTGFVGYRFAV